MIFRGWNDLICICLAVPAFQSFQYTHTYTAKLGWPRSFATRSVAYVCTITCLPLPCGASVIKAIAQSPCMLFSSSEIARPGIEQSVIASNHLHDKAEAQTGPLQSHAHGRFPSLLRRETERKRASSCLSTNNARTRFRCCMHRASMAMIMKSCNHAAAAVPWKRFLLLGLIFAYSHTSSSASLGPDAGTSPRHTCVGYRQPCRLSPNNSSIQQLPLFPPTRLHEEDPPAIVPP